MWRIALILVAAGTAFALGYSGFRQISNGRQDIADSVYHALRLFRLDADVADGEAPWQLNVARFLAPLVVAYAVLAAALALLRHRIEAWLVRRRARDHVVVIGSTEQADVIVETLHFERRARRRTAWAEFWTEPASALRRLLATDYIVVVDDGSRSARRAGMRAAGARVVVSDTRQQAAARAARVRTASHVVVLAGTDDDNLQALAAANAALGPTASTAPGSGARHRHRTSGSRGPTFHVGISDPMTWRELGLYALSAGTDDRTEFFSLTDRTARRLADEAAAQAQGAVVRRCVVDGAGPLAARLVSHLVRRAVHGATRTLILLPPEPGRQLLAELEAAEPWCLDAADIEICDFDDDLDVSIGLVCGKDADPVLLAKGLALSHRLPHAQVLVGVASEQRMELDQLIGIPVQRITVVNAQAAALARDLFDHATFEIIARAKHEDYVRREHERGITPAQNESMRPWEDLPDSLKDSNRRFAEAVGPMIGTLGGVIRPLTQAPVLHDLDLPASLLERLAQDEHQRWVREREQDGWKPTRGAKDPAKKLHPLLIPWDDLPEKEKEKDRDVFRALPRMLSLVGYELVMPTGDRVSA